MWLVLKAGRAVIAAMALFAVPVIAADEDPQQRVAVVDGEDERRRAGEEKKRVIVEKLRDEVARIEKDKSVALRKQKPRLSAELTKRLNEKKAELKAAETKTAEQYVAEMDAAAEAEQRAARAKAIEASRPPLEITATGINPNVIGIPELTIRVQNTKNLKVEAFEIDVECFDKFGDPVTWPGQGNVYRGISQTTVEAKQVVERSWDLHLHRNTAEAKLWISRVKMSDGSVWEQSRADAVRGGNVAPARKMR